MQKMQRRFVVFGCVIDICSADTRVITVGHFAKDCPQGGGPKTCRNCGLVLILGTPTSVERETNKVNSEEGHISKECDKPRNLDTVTCRNCEESKVSYI